MAIEPDRVESAQDLPERTDVLVIGGGIIGAATALYLARAGAGVVLVEKGVVAGEQSGQNWGWIRSQNRDVSEIGLMARSMALWDEIQAEAGEIGFRRSGALHLAETAAEVQAFRGWLALPGAAETGAEILDPSAVTRKLGDSHDRYAGGFFTAGDGRAEPQKAAPAVARLARAAGATIVTGCAALSLRLDPTGRRIIGAVTERGFIAAGQVVVAAGHWSGQLLRGIGIDLPQLRVLSSVARTVPTERRLEFSVVGPGFSLRPRLDGGYTVSAGLTVMADILPDGLRHFRSFLPVLKDRKAYGARFRFGRRFFEELGYAVRGPATFARVRRLEPDPAGLQLRIMRATLAERFAWLAAVPLAETWAGCFDVTPDARPVISAVDGIDGLVISTGYSGHGFGLGPAAGELTADLAAKRPARVDPAPFHLDRFR